MIWADRLSLRLFLVLLGVLLIAIGSGAGVNDFGDAARAAVRIAGSLSAFVWLVGRALDYVFAGGLRAGNLCIEV